MMYLYVYKDGKEHKLLVKYTFCKGEPGTRMNPSIEPALENVSIFSVYNNSKRLINYELSDEEYNKIIETEIEDRKETKEETKVDNFILSGNNIGCYQCL